MNLLFSTNSRFESVKREIIDWCEMMKTRDYTINDNSERGSDDSFSCRHDKLTSLENCLKVDGDFDYSNNKVKFTKEDVLRYCKYKESNINV